MLGTVQFGLNYGVANQSGQPPYEEVKEILANAFEGGVNCLDTAAGYGGSEEVLGRALSELGIKDRMVIVSKITRMANDLSAPEADALIEESVMSSLKKLRLEVLPVCLFHNEENFCYIDSLLKLKNRGLIQYVGSSTESLEVTRAIVSSGRAEAIQIPTSILDRRFITSAVCSEAVERKTAIFARSVYLQGLILMSSEEIPSELKEVVPICHQLAHLAGQAGMTLAELAMRYARGIDELTCILVGVQSVSQMKQNLEIFSKGPLDTELVKAVRSVVPELPERILNPRMWSRRMSDVKSKRKEDLSTSPAQTA